ncbi:UNVERIFIED_CONTAM: Aldose 1-epimerase [Sesamum radiatum]|uniref:Aldose 1-epimerase n=1 Tax=Sesamum radiatum TaxID=300843 RepID=A0AAW2PKR8_SESRA
MGKAYRCFCVVITAFAVLSCEAAEEIGIYELQRGDFSVKITNYGATVLSVVLPDRNGKLDDVVLGYGSIDEYKNDTTYFGAIVGRVANRIGGAKFTLNGTLYNLPANDHGNTLHGGTIGFSDVIWTVESYVENSHLTLTYHSHDGEQASHTYWNLGGHTSGDILSHTIHLRASRITPVDDKLIPTGEISPVKGTPYDFLEPRKIGSKFTELPDGYDINYVLDRTGDGKHFTKVATVHEEKSGRKMELWTNQPGVQFYTSNMLPDTVGKGGSVYKKHAAFCLETQGFPDSVNHPNFPSQILVPGVEYRNVMVYRFTAS